MIRRILAVAAVCLVVASAGAQTEKRREPDSPVFKNYKPPEQPASLPQSDALYQIWEAFVLSRKANAGDPLAQQELGVRYLLGRGVDIDTVRAAYWTAKAAEKGLPIAKYNLAIFFYNGWGVQWNLFESFRAFLFAADHGMREAEFAVGTFYLDDLVVPRDLDKARSWFGKAAGDGFARAKEALRLLARAGDAGGDSSVERPRTFPLPSSGPVLAGVSDDSAGSGNNLLDLQKALGSAGPEMRRALGFSKMLEGPVTLDSTTFHEIVSAADQGSPEALSVVGRCYEKGIVLERDPVLAAAQYIRAIRMDSQPSAQLLWELTGSRDFFPVLKARANAGEPAAEYVWAGLLALGFGGRLQEAQAYLTGPQALDLLRKASSQKYPGAMLELGLCYYAGRWTAPDRNRARELWSGAAALGSHEAEIRLAVTEIEGDTTSAPLLPGVLQVLLQGMDDGSILAQTALGYCYEHGVGVTKDIPRAAQLYEAAMRRGSLDAFRALRSMLDRTRPPDPEFRMQD